MCTVLFNPGWNKRLTSVTDNFAKIIFAKKQWRSYDKATYNTLKYEKKYLLQVHDNWLILKQEALSKFKLKFIDLYQFFNIF